MSDTRARNTIDLRLATAADAPAAVGLLRRSITELCHADHKGDDRALAGWLANKNETNMLTWIARQDAVVILAERDKTIVGLGMIDHGGTVLLNYVDPDARFSGVSKAILGRLEDVARGRGLDRCLLDSTETARGFYQMRGYQPAGDGGMEKAL